MINEKSTTGVPLWLSGLRIWCCHCCGSGYCSGTGSVPGLRTSACRRCSQEKKKFTKIHQIHKFLRTPDYINSLEDKVLNTHTPHSLCASVESIFKAIYIISMNLAFFTLNLNNQNLPLYNFCPFVQLLLKESGQVSSLN